MEQKLAVLVTLVGCGMLLALFASVARSAGTKESAENVAAAAARWRKNAFWGLVVLFVPIIGFSLTRLPYSSGSGGIDTVVIQATGHQWAWQINPDTVPTGRPIEIRVTGADVNHGFALYDANNRLMVQTQGMPGYTNTLRFEFTQPGTFQVRCLEYCGLGHHTMNAQLVVTSGLATSR
jgi:cytochrome c oxidase subunit 2